MVKSGDSGFSIIINSITIIFNFTTSINFTTTTVSWFCQHTSA